MLTQSRIQLILIRVFQLMFYIILSAGVAYAETLGWFLKMCISDAATLFSCIITGTAFSTLHKATIFFQS